MVSKVVSVGLEMIEEFRPDFIWSYYLEPFGVAALYLHILTGVAYTIRHAGTDLGRLFRTDQLNRLYKEVFKQALVVFSKRNHHGEFVEMGVRAEHLIEPISPRLPGDIFFPEPMPPITGGLRLGVYGKVGPAKGTGQLLEAIANLRDGGYPLFVTALWGGRGIEKYLAMAKTLDLEEPCLKVKPFIPHWSIPSFIRSMHAIAFLENQFHITFHAPGVPLEVNACGRFLITTTEITQKDRVSRVIEDSVTAFVVPADPLTTKDVISAIKRVGGALTSGQGVPIDRVFDASLYSAQARVRISEHLREIARRL